MKLIEHLEGVIGLVDNTRPYPAIKTALLAMHQEIEGYDAALANQIRLNQEQAKTISDLMAKFDELYIRSLRYKEPDSPSDQSYFPTSGLIHPERMENPPSA